jgi:hypothetical protein
MHDKMIRAWVEERLVLLVPSDAEVHMVAVAEDLQNHPPSWGALARAGDLDPVAFLRCAGVLIVSVAAL